MKGNFEQKHCGNPERVWHQSWVGRRTRKCGGILPMPFPQCRTGYWASAESEGICYGPSLPGLGQRRRWLSYKTAFFFIVGADSSRYPHLPLKCHVMQGFPALFTACVVYAYISTNTVKCLLSRCVLTINVCVYACVSILTAFLGSGVLFYCSEDTLLYNVYIF